MYYFLRPVLKTASQSDNTSCCYSAEESKSATAVAASSAISAKLVRMLAINAMVTGSNPTIDGYFSTSLKELGKPSRLL